MEVIVQPSVNDALSQSLIESLMMQRPIVATNISGAADTIDGGKYGELVTPTDSKSFRNDLEEVTENLDVALENAKFSKNYLLEYMNAQKTADEYGKIYRNMVN